jgi:glycosyltransferase involved in cell wall biosynthesis
MLEPTVHILLATYQGEAYLGQQLASLTAQSYLNWVLHVSDDGSSDGTQGIVAEFALKSPQTVRFCTGSGKGATHNFFHLMNTVAAANPSDLYAFCDQDDVWLPDKLENAVLHHATQTLVPNQPYLYCGRTRIVDKQLVELGLTPSPRKQLGFGNALLQNVASGNTMVFNLALLKILRQISPQNSVLHDWTAYQAVTGCGGVMHFADQPSLFYRQHGANVVGSNTGFASRMRRLRFLLKGGYKGWSLQTVRAMRQIEPRLAPTNRVLLNKFKEVWQKSNPLRRLSLLTGKQIWRQTHLGQVSLILALLFNLI